MTKRKSAKHDEHAIMPLPMPAGWTLGQEKWAALPAVTQSEIARACREFEAGIAKYAPRAQRQLELEALFGNPKHGPSIRQKLERFVGIEHLLRTDFDRGVLHVCSLANVHPRHLALAILHDLHPAATELYRFVPHEVGEVA